MLYIFGSDGFASHILSSSLRLPLAFLGIFLMDSSPNTHLDLSLKLATNSSSSSSSYSNPPSPVTIAAPPPSTVVPSSTSTTLPAPPSLQQVAEMWAYQDRRAMAHMSNEQLIQYSTHLLTQASIVSAILGQRLRARSAEVGGLRASPPRNQSVRAIEENGSLWDILSNGGMVHEMAHIANGRDTGNCVSPLLRSSNSSQSNMLILQESCTDATASFVIYAPVDIAAMNGVLNGSDPDYVALLPSGFAILPDGAGIGDSGSSGSLLTMAFQILVDSVPTANLSLPTINNLIACTVERTKAALSGDNGA